MGLNERQIKVIELYAQGTPITDIAKICGCSRQTIYDDLSKSDVKAGVDRSLTEIKTQVEKKVVNKLDSYIEELHKLALTSKSEKTKLDALQYLTDRGLGKATSKVNVTTNEKENDSVDDNILKGIIEKEGSEDNE